MSTYLRKPLEIKDFYQQIYLFIDMDMCILLGKEKVFQFLFQKKEFGLSGMYEDGKGMYPESEITYQRYFHFSYPCFNE